MRRSRRSAGCQDCKEVVGAHALSQPAPVGRPEGQSTGEDQTAVISQEGWGQGSACLNPEGSRWPGRHINGCCWQMACGPGGGGQGLRAGLREARVQTVLLRETSRFQDGSALLGRSFLGNYRACAWLPCHSRPLVQRLNEAQC